MEVKEFVQRGAKARAKKLGSRRLSEISTLGAHALWSGHSKGDPECNCRGCEVGTHSIWSGHKKGDAACRCKGCRRRSKTVKKEAV